MQGTHLERSEQRRHPRFEVRIGAEVQTADKEVTCTTKNLSLGGVALDLDRPIAQGGFALVTLFVVVDDIEDLATRPLELPGSVVWCRQVDPEHYEAGIRFEPLAEDARRYLEQLLALQRG